MPGLFDFLTGGLKKSGHENYYEVEADSHAELGRKLGYLFGETAAEYIDWEAHDKKAWKRKKAAAAPLLEQTRAIFPQYVEELTAYAQEAELPLIDVWALCLEDELEYREKCTSIVTNKGNLISHNEDWDSDSEDAICVLKKTLRDTTIFELYYFAVPLGGCAFSINSHGVIQAINSLHHSDRQMGVPKCIIGRWLSETSDLQDDLKKLESIQRSSGYAHTFVSLLDGVVAMESSASRHIVFEPQLPFAHSNHYTQDALKSFERADDSYSTFDRYKSACALVRGEMSMKALMDVTGDRSNGKWNSLLNRETIGRIVVDVPARKAQIWLRREKDAGWVEYPLDFLPAVSNIPVG